MLLSLFIILLLLVAGCTGKPQPLVSTGPVPTITTSVIVPVSTPEPETRGALVAFVQRAVSYAKTEGKEKALAEFDKRNGSFFEGQLYIYAYDWNGTTIAHPVNPEKIGVNRLIEKDAAGSFFIRELRDAAKNGSGFVEYYYINPTHNNAIEKKLGYVMKVDDSWWLGSGIYAGTESEGDITTHQLVAEAKTYALSNGKAAAIDEFNNLSGRFVRDGLYVFAYDYNGTTLAYPYRIDLLGVNRMNSTDVTGKQHIREMVTTAKNGSGTVYYFSKNPLYDNATELKASYLMDVDGTWFIGAGT
jgi:polar amino acid transport system substrate-binding protein